MVSYSTSDFKPGLKILIDGEPCEIIEDEFVKPGKGQAFSKVKFRNLVTGRSGGTSDRGCDSNCMGSGPAHSIRAIREPIVCQRVLPIRK